MLKYKLMLAVLLGLVLLPTLALADWAGCNVGSCPSCKTEAPCSTCRTVSAAIDSCQTPCKSSAEQVTKAEPSIPVVVPMECLTVNGKACLSPCSASTEPTDMRMFNVTVPVTIQTINGCPTLTTRYDEQLANKVVLVPTASADKQIMLPVLMKPTRDKMMVFTPLDTTLISASASAAVAMYVNDKMAMVPLNWSGCVTNASLCLPTEPFEAKAQADINKQ
ncbi:MAG: hypothetical protein ACM3VW_05870 [Bacteroidota bacterium]